MDFALNPYGLRAVTINLRKGGAYPFANTKVPLEYIGARRVRKVSLVSVGRASNLRQNLLDYT